MKQLSKKMNSFEDYFNARKKYIAETCTYLNGHSNNRIEYKDLYQEAALKLFTMYKDDKPLDINYSRFAIKNHLIDYIRKRSLSKEFISLDTLLSEGTDFEYKAEKGFNPQVKNVKKDDEPDYYSSVLILSVSTGYCYYCKAPTDKHFCSPACKKLYETPYNMMTTEDWNKLKKIDKRIM